MPHQCVRCSEIYDDGDKVILEGCPCGGKLFFYLSEKKLKLLKERDEKEQIQLSDKQKRELEKDILDIVGNKKEPDEPVILDFESINVKTPGKYEIDLVNLFKKEPLIFKLEDGKYVIDIPETFKHFSKGKKKKR
ncbi:Zn-ribbon domain-containing protein [Candidatus Woesearchaeota archaeon]|nr:Zn-ribbon domain-containing protein [Candidatus Woesearchaeota archaeon]